MTFVVTYANYLINAAAVILTTITSVVGQTQCNNNILWANESANYLASPNYPNNYSSNLDCQWLITTSLSTNVVVLKLLDFYLEDRSLCDYDYVAIYDGDNIYSPQIEQLCGQHSNRVFTSTGSSMTIMLHSDQNLNYRGFKFEYTSKNKSGLCGETNLLASVFPNYLTSPNYPDKYPNNMDCQFLITADSHTSIIEVEVTNFNLGECQNDYVKIFDGTSASFPLIKLLCGQTTTRWFKSAFSEMTIVFHSDGNYNYNGFKFKYQSKKTRATACPDITLWANETEGYITSPNYPKMYPHKYSPRIELLCGQVLNTTFTSTGSSMTVVFHSDSKNHYRGFMFQYMSQETLALCGDTNLWANENVKKLTSPGYPNNYPNNMDCQWLITASLSSKVVMLFLLDFNMEGYSPLCSSEYLAIYDGNSRTSPRIKLLCGQASNETFISNGRSLTIVFHSNLSKIYNRFKFEYISKEKSEQCEDVYLSADETVQYFTSPGYPKQYLNNMDCQWGLRASSLSNVVVLKVLDFFLEGISPSCRHDYVAVYDGDSKYSPRVDLLCGQLVSTQFISTDSFMTVVFHSDSAYSYKGFKLEYISQEKAAPCKDVILFANSTAKYLTSPNYPYLYPSNTDCEWYIISDLDSSVVSLVFSEVSLEGNQPNCINDFVKIYDGSSTDSSQIALMCGHMYGRTINSTSTFITIVFHSNGRNSYKGFNCTYQSHIKAHINTGHSVSTIVAISTSLTVGPVIIIIILIIFIKKRISKRKLRNTQNSFQNSNSDRENRENSQFIMNDMSIDTRAISAPCGEMEESQTTFNPPSYSSLNLNVNADLPAYSDSGYSINDLPPPYSVDLPGGAEYQEQFGPHNDSRLERSHYDGENGAQINFNNRTKVVSDHMNGQNLSADVNPSREILVDAFTALSCLPSCSDARNPSCPENSLVHSESPTCAGVSGLLNEKGL